MSKIKSSTKPRKSGRTAEPNSITGDRRRWTYGGAKKIVDELLQVAEAEAAYPLQGWGVVPLDVCERIYAILSKRADLYGHVLSMKREEAAVISLTVAERQYCESEGIPEEEFLERKRGSVTEPPPRGPFDE